MTAQRVGAYVELRPHHGELAPTFWWLAQRAGFDLHMWLHPHVRSLGPFAGADGPVTFCDWQPAPTGDPVLPAALAGALASGDYDFLVVGSTEPSTLPAVAGAHPKTMLVLHNLDWVRAAPGDATPCVLTRRWQARLGDGAEHVPALFLGDVDPADKPRNAVFAVPGQVSARKNYRSLVRCLRELAAEGRTPDDVRMRIVGRSHQHHAAYSRMTLLGDHLRQVLWRHDLLDFVEFPHGELTYAELGAHMRTSRYALPLLDDFHWPARAYVNGKGSGASNQAIATLCIPVINRAYAASLGLDAGHHYRVDDVASAVRRALDSGDDDVEIQRVATYRRRELEAAAERFARWVRA